MNWFRRIGLKEFLALALALVAAALRFYHLEVKPIHHDEAVNGWITAQSWMNGFVDYDPTNFHGVLLFLFYQLAELIAGPGIWIYRSVSVLFMLGSLVVLLIGFRGLSWGSILSGVVLILSPAFFFFSRSAIHESAFLFFQVLFVVAFLKTEDRVSRDRWLGLAMLGLVGMILLKETFVLLILPFLVVIAVEPGLRKIFLQDRWNWLLPAAVPFGIFAFIQTGFFQKGSELMDAVVAFLPWLKTGTDLNGHAKPWFYWLELMWRYEPALLVALLVSLWGAVHREEKLRRISRLALGVFALYSLIPYKTVWCFISLSWLFLPTLIEAWPHLRKWAQLGLAGLLLGLSLHSAWTQIPLLIQSDYHSRTHPYFYVETSTETMELYSRLLHRFQQKPLLMEAPLVWQAREVWPWPWLIQDMAQQTAVTELTADHQKAGLIFSSPEEADLRRSLFEGTHQEFQMPLRVEGPKISVFVRKDLLEGTP